MTETDDLALWDRRGYRWGPETLGYGVCLLCGVETIWHSRREKERHVQACEAIEVGLRLDGTIPHSRWRKAL